MKSENQKIRIKKIIASLLIGIGLFGISSFSEMHYPRTKGERTELSKCRFAQCSAITKSGARCKNCVSKSGDLNCHIHR